jgi:hypothetical protein
MSDGACTAASSLTVRVTDDDVVVAFGNVMVTRCVSEAAAD